MIWHIEQSSQSIPPQPSGLFNNVAFTVTGSGFGTKAANVAPLYDDCQGTTLAATGWNSARAFYTTTTIQSEPWGEHYRLPTDTTPNSDTWGATTGAIVNPATPYRSKYLCSALMSANIGGYAAASMMFGYTWSTLVPPFYIVASWYEAISPNWGFGSTYGYGGNGDNNFKWIDYTSNLTGPYAPTTNYWYMEDGNSEFTSATATPTVDINDDSGGHTGTASGTGGVDYHGANMPSKYYNDINGWVKKEFTMRADTTTSGWVQLYLSQPQNGARFNAYRWDNTTGAATGITDALPGTGRGFYIGGFRRNFPHAQNRQYWSDVYFEMQASNIGRFALTDTNSLTTAKIIEYQPYTSWSNTSVTLTCQKGNLAAGTVYLWYLDDINGNQFLGSYTMN